MLIHMGRDSAGSLRAEFSIYTDIVDFHFSGAGTIPEICESVAAQIQDAGVAYRVMKDF